MSGLDNYTKLLLHCDGADGSTNFIDSSFSGKTITAVGNAQIDTAQYKFGGASALFDGNGDYLSIPDSDDWAFGSGDFTIDFWVRFNALPADGKRASFYYQLDSTSNDIMFDLANNNGVYIWRFLVYISGSSIINVQKSATISVATWYHMAVVRNGNDYMIFQNGTQVGATVTDTDTIPDYISTLRIGDRPLTDYSFNGWLDEYRISKGIARWTSNFTPPTRPYTRSQAAFLLNMI